MATTKKRRAIPILPIHPKDKPGVHVQFSRNSRRLQIIVQLTGTEAEVLYEKLDKRYGKKDK